MRARQEGFTLAEVVIAIVVFVFGIMAIANLFTLATSSNVVARNMTASTAQATEAMEMLKAIPFSGLIPAGQVSLCNSGSPDLNTGADTTHTWDQGQPMQVDLNGDKAADTYCAADRDVAGVGRIRIRWQVLAIDNQTRQIRVTAAPASIALRGRSRVDLVTFRTCTGPNVGCPATP